jgi:hypothetical protein
MNAATAHAGTGTDWVSVLLSYWWLALIFGGAILEWIGETFDVGLAALYHRAELRHQRQMDLKRVELEILQARPGAASSSLPRPGPCVHRNVTPVIAAGEDKPCAWLCRCGERLPADWAVREEDL